MKKTITYILIIFSSVFALAQNDTANYIQYDFGFLFDDGLYTNFESFRNNTPVPYESFISPSYHQESFFEVMDSVNVIVYNDEFGVSKTIRKEDIWGYSKNGKPYIYWAEKFNLIPYVGRISHFITTVKVLYTNYRDPYYDPYYYNPGSRVYQSDELRQFIIDMDTGEIIDYSLQNVESLLQRDNKIYDEFMQLRKRKRAKEMFYYVRLYNEVNHFYIPKKDK